MKRPPRLAEWWLALWVWPDEREAVLGDFSEQFARRAATAGGLRATWWYWRESLRLGWSVRARDSGARWGRGSLMAFDDIRHAVRRLRHQPIGSVVSIIALALGIGAAAATWSLMSAVLLNPLRVEAPERLVRVGFEQQTSRGVSFRDAFTYRKYAPIRDAGVFERLAAIGTVTGVTPLLVGSGDAAREAVVYFASHDFFDTVGVRLSLGRAFTPDEDRRGAAPVAILSDRLWRSEFHADPNALGQTVRVRDRTVQIVGVAPRGFRGLSLATAPDLYMPLHTIEQVQPIGNLYDESVEATGFSPTAWVRLVGRLPDGQSAALVAGRLNGMTFDVFQDRTFVLTDVVTAAIPAAARTGVTQFTRLVAVSVGLLLALGCLTVGTLLLIRTEARGDEFAMCLALGASRGRLARGVAVEGVLLAAVGGLLALPVSQALFVGLRPFELPGSLRLDLLELTIDRRVVAAAVVAAAVSTILMSGVASLLGFRTTLAAVLRSRSGGTPRLTGRRSRALLVTAQVAVAVVLATGAGLFARSVVKALTINPAFPTDRLITGSLYLDVQGYDVPRADAFFADLRAPLAANPAVEALGFSYSPGSSGGGYPMWIDGEPRDLPSDMPYVGVDDTYFDTIGLRIIQGRDFTSDDRAGAPLVAIVSDSLARFVAPAGDALGHRIRESSRRPGQPYATIEIVGVVPDIIARVSRLEPLVLYRPIAQQNGMPRKILMLRAARDPAEAIREVLAAVKTLDPVVRPRGFATMNQLMLEQMGPQRFGMTVMGALGGIAVLLAVLGAYVLAESMASLRRREMGIRSALGASGLHLRGLVLSETARLVGIGLLAGLVLVWLGSNAIRGFLFQVEPLDPLVIGGVAAAIAVLTLVVSLRPAISAGRVDLAQMLREE